MVDIEIEFRDGRLVCVGEVAMEGAEFVSVDQTGVWEQSPHGVEVTIAEGILYLDGREIDLEPGEYLVNATGLYRRVATDEAD